MPHPPKSRVLVVEDDPKTANLVRLYLEHAGYEVTVALDGREGLRLVNQKPGPDLVVLDVMLPHVDGLRLCREVRLGSDAAVILLTARSTEEDRLEGLDLGADDYVVKPFSPRELVARVRAVLRRRTPGDSGSGSGGTGRRGAGGAPTSVGTPAGAAATAPKAFRTGMIELDPGSHEARVEGRRVDLTPREFALLHALARQPGRVFSRDDLAAAAFGPDYEGSERTIDAHVKNLRAKIERDPAAPAVIVTVFGVGYRFARGEGDA
jgi:DNA-binding response OmpR family regulator